MYRALRRPARPKMLCPICGDLRSLTTPGRLACGHTRTGSLPARGISLEKIDTPQGARLYPRSWADEVRYEIREKE